MKVTSKLSIVFFLLCFIVTCFNCQNDDDNTQSKQNTDQSRYSIKVVDRAFFEDKPDLSRKLNSMNSKPKGKNKSNSGLNREIYNEEYGFTIETDYVKYIEDLQTGYHSFSFPIVKDYPEDDKVENLVFHSNDNETYDAYIVKYGFTKDEYEILNQEQLKDLSTKYTSIIFDDIEFPTSEDSNRVSMDLECVKVWAYMLVPNNEGELVGGEPLYTHEWVMIAMECDWETTTDGGGSDSSDGTGGGTSGPDNGPHGNGVVIPQYPILSSPNVIQPWQEVVHCVNSISEAGSTDSTTLTPEMINWLHGADKYTVNLINNFLNQNNCSEEAQELTIEIAQAELNESLITLSPFVKYPDELAQQYQDSFPNFTNYLKNELIDLKNDQEIINALDQIGLATQDQIIEALTWGSGPTVRITPLSSDNTILGRYNPTPLGEDGANYGPNVIEINSYFVDLIEETMNSENPQYNIKALKFFIGIIILHEFTHYADFNYTGNAFVQSGIETGDLFETNLLYDLIVDGQPFDITIGNFNETIQQYFLIRE